MDLEELERAARRAGIHCGGRYVRNSRALYWFDAGDRRREFEAVRKGPQVVLRRHGRRDVVKSARPDTGFEGPKKAALKAYHVALARALAARTKAARKRGEVPRRPARSFSFFERNGDRVGVVIDGNTCTVVSFSKNARGVLTVRANATRAKDVTGAHAIAARKTDELVRKGFLPATADARTRKLFLTRARAAAPRRA